MNSFFQHLNAPEYMHVLLNPVPVYGLAMGFIALLGGLIWRNGGARVAGLALIVLAGISAWPVYQYGEAGYDRVKSMADSAGDKCGSDWRLLASSNMALCSDWGG